MATATLNSQEVAANKPGKTGSPVRCGATDDEILGIGASCETPTPQDRQTEFNLNKDDPDAERATQQEREAESITGADLKAALDANPELRSAWEDAEAYRKTFATPQDALAASTRLADLDRLDALFFSRKPEDHAELARAVAALDPAAFNSLANAMTQLVASTQSRGGQAERAEMLSLPQVAQRGSGAHGQSVSAPASSAQAQTSQNETASERKGLSPAQTEFFHSANAAAVEEVLHAIESQVERLLPEEISKSARNRVVGEIYRELDSTLQSNRQLAQQMREALRSGPLDAAHQRAIVSLVAGRARQALPAVAKRVLNEWTSTIVAANQERRARQRTAERRVDIAGSGRTGSDGRRLTSPRDIDYARMSDSDILNL